MAINGFPSDGSPQSPASGAVTTNSAPKDLICTHVPVAASQTLATLSERKGSYLSHIIVQPATVNAGTVIVYDGDGSNKVAVLTFPGGTGSVADVAPFEIPIHSHAEVVESGAEGWYVTTGENVSIVAVVQVG